MAGCWLLITVSRIQPPDWAKIQTRFPPISSSPLSVARTHRCRKGVFSLPTDRATIERTDNFLFHDSQSLRFNERRLRFAEIMFRSKFVLCPRGHGTSSFRLYETLAAGRVPVIISDAWVPPHGPTWNDFSIRWPEAKIAELPARLREIEPDAEMMGLMARRTYDRWFAPDVVLANQLSQLERLLNRSNGTFPAGGYKNRQYFHLQARHFRSKIRRQ